ncbi:MAG: phosphoribosylaminoimidazolesuccinocarboxamide synthase [Candidatus Kryptoniota bacterium]
MAKKDRRPIVSKGSSKILYSLPQDDILLAEFRSEVGVDGKKVFKIKSRPKIALELQAFIFAFLETYQIPTHFFSQNGGELFVKRLNIIPVEVTVRNFASQSFARRFKHFKPKQQLEFPIFEYLLRDEAGEFLVTDTHMYALQLLTPDEFRTINRLASKIDAVMKSFLERRGLTLIDITMKFGRYKGVIMLGDEISPENITAIDNATGEEISVASARDSREASKYYQFVYDRIFPAAPRAAASSAKHKA